MFNIRTTMLFVVTLTLVTVLAIASYVRMSTTSTSRSLPAADAFPKSVDPASANPGSSYGTDMSTQSIRHILDWEYEHYRFGPAEKQLQHILDGRYERRVNLPY